MSEGTKEGRPRFSLFPPGIVVSECVCECVCIYTVHVCICCACVPVCTCMSMCEGTCVYALYVCECVCVHVYVTVCTCEFNPRAASHAPPGQGRPPARTCTPGTARPPAPALPEAVLRLQAAPSPPLNSCSPSWHTFPCHISFAESCL